MKSSGTGKYVIATIKSWNIKEAKQFARKNTDMEVLLVTDKKDLTYEKINQFKPRYIFFPHWSWIILKEVYENFECVVFHMTDLPFGRGGSPLQNLIARGIYKTKLSALKVVEEVDAGPIYFKRDLDLSGNATEIFKRTVELIFSDMIPEIIKNNPEPVPQEGEIVMFKRRTPEESDISGLADNTKIYDYVRMLDVEGHSLAFIETSKLRVEFSKAKVENWYILAQAKIKVKDE